MNKFFLTALLVSGMAFAAQAQSTETDAATQQPTVVSAGTETGTPAKKSCCKSTKEKATASASKKSCCKDGKNASSCHDKKSSAAVKEENDAPAEHTH